MKHLRSTSLQGATSASSHQQRNAIMQEVSSVDTKHKQQKSFSLSPYLVTSTLKGFSLMEIAIALIVIGVMAGLAMKGYSLVENARLKSVYAKVEEIRTATLLFTERYQALPGDFSAAQSIDTTLKNGNSDGTISGSGLEAQAEALQFWQHLEACHLLTGAGKPPASGHATFSHGAPGARIGGGFTIADNMENTPGPWIVLGNQNGTAGDRSGLSPLQAEQLDRAYDDGHPETGSIRAVKGKFAVGECLTSNKTYDLKNKSPACIVLFTLQ